MCDCAMECDELLAPRNLRLVYAALITQELQLEARLCVATEKIDSTKRWVLPAITVNYCPFCGEKQ